MPENGHRKHLLSDQGFSGYDILKHEKRTDRRAVFSSKSYDDETLTFFSIMNCPKCRHEQNEINIVCEKCGIYFAKYSSALNSKSKDTEKSIAHSSQRDNSSTFSFGELFFYRKIMSGNRHSNSSSVLCMGWNTLI
jgi:hypothetical protein